MRYKSLVASCLQTGSFWNYMTVYYTCCFSFAGTCTPLCTSAVALTECRGPRRTSQPPRAPAGDTERLSPTRPEASRPPSAARPRSTRQAPTAGLRPRQEAGAPAESPDGVATPADPCFQWGDPAPDKGKVPELLATRDPLVARIRTACHPGRGGGFGRPEARRGAGCSIGARGPVSLTQGTVVLPSPAPRSGPRPGVRLPDSQERGRAQSLWRLRSSCRFITSAPPNQGEQRIQSELSSKASSRLFQHLVTFRISHLRIGTRISIASA